MAHDTIAHNPNGPLHDIVPGSNDFHSNEASALVNNHSFGAQVGDPFAEHQLWPIAAEDFTFQYPSFTVGTDDVFHATNQWLQPHPDYRPPNQDRDLLLSAPAAPISNPLQLERLGEINQRSLSQQDLFGTQPHRPQKAPLKWQSAAADGFYEAQQAGTLPHIAPSHQYPANLDQHLRDDVTLLPLSTPTPNSRRCFECCFAHKPCIISIPGSPCDRCTRLYDNMHATPRHSKPLNDASFLFVDTVVFFDMRATQNLLSRLRGAAEAITNLPPGITLEDYFKGSIVCQMDNRIIPNSTFSVTGVLVVVKHLATTRTALAVAESLNQRFPLPGLDDIQMDSFIDVSNRMHDLQELHRSEQAIIITALRCSDYIGILFNWDLNAICFEGTSSIPQAKNLVLETAYAMSYRVQQLLMILCHEVNQSLLGNYTQDPATIACALRIVYQSIDRFKKLKWNAGSLQDLRNFLNGLHDRAPAALKALDRYRVNVAFLRCGKTSQGVKAFQALIDAKKTPKSAVSFTYQHYRIDETFVRLPNLYSQQTYTEVLETRFVNWGTFGFKLFSPSDFDQIENQTLKNAEKSDAMETSSKITLAELVQEDKPSTKRSYAGSVSSVTCETGSVVDGESEHDQYTTTPSLTMNTTLPEKSDTSLDAKIRRTETRLENLKKLKSSERHLTDEADIYEDWAGFVE